MISPSLVAYHIEKEEGGGGGGWGMPARFFRPLQVPSMSDDDHGDFSVSGFVRFHRCFTLLAN